MTASVVIPTWNRRDLLEGVLRGLRGQTRQPDEVVVVDNASRDGSAEYAASAGARVLRLPRNEGFAVAVNHGIRAAAGEAVAVVNNDVELDADWLRLLLQTLEAPSVWFACGKTLDADEPSRIDGTFDAVALSACPWRCGQGRPDGALWDEPRAIRMTSWTAAVFRRELFEQLGLLDERFESYFEDVEFGLRCCSRERRGWYEPRAVARHRGSATLGRWNRDSVRRMARNQVFLLARHFGPGMLRRHWWRILVGQTLWGLVALRHGAGAAFVRGKCEGWRRFPALRGEVFTGRLEEQLAASEREILELQQACGFDLYWRLYFALT